MMNKIFCFFICLLFVDCSDDKSKLPAVILPVQKMAEIMVDVDLLEASVNLNVYKNDSIASKENLSAAILKKHQITQKQYQENFEYYSEHLDSLNKIYELVLIDLSKMQAEIVNKKEIKKDSIHTQTNKNLIISPLSRIGGGTE